MIPKAGEQRTDVLTSAAELARAFECPDLPVVEWTTEAGEQYAYIDLGELEGIVVDIVVELPCSKSDVADMIVDAVVARYRA
jgi:hypothetical protein